MKKTFIAVLVISAICFSAFAEYGSTGYFSLGAKFNLGTKQESKQISSIEFWENYTMYGEFHYFSEQASFLYSCENKNDNTFSLDLAYVPEIKNHNHRSNRWFAPAL